MSRPTTPRPMILALATLLLAALATPSCSLLSKPSSGPSSSGGGSVPAKPAANSGEASETATSAAGVQVIDSTGLRDLGAQEATIVDVRAKDDFELEHLPDAVNVPMSEFTKKAAKWAEDEAVVVYGSKDAKAQTAASWLVRNGFQQVYRLSGGIEEWDGERDGVLSKYRLDKPTAIYVYTKDCSVCAQATPKFDELAKEYGKKVDFQKWDAAEMVGKVRLFTGELATAEDAEAAAKIGQRTAIITAVPTFILVVDDPRTYRKVVGLQGLQVLHSWLQEQ